ncbi:MAG: hypothetical protein ACKO96_28670, partial [Flammeovirgaceae bacterium]
ESLLLIAQPGTLVSSVVPLFIRSILLFVMGIYYTVVIIYTSEKVEEKLIHFLKKAQNEAAAQNIEIKLNNPPLQIEEVKEQTKGIELNEEKGGNKYEVV